MTDIAWNLVADVGGTNARFAVAECDSGELIASHQYSVAEFDHFNDAISQFLSVVLELGDHQPLPRAVCLALACPVTGDKVQFTNSPWQLDRKEISKLLGDIEVELINDFAAVGYGIPGLSADEWIDIRTGVEYPYAPIVVVGPGTGLGVCTVVQTTHGYQVFPGEGGHVDFAPVDELDVAILTHMQERLDRVSAERIVSGTGLLNTYNALSELAGEKPALTTPAEISAAALDGSDDFAVTTLHVFCRNLGSIAGNLALTLGARGGVYIAGGVIPRFADFFHDSDFLNRFDAKGRMASYLGGIPIRLITRGDIGLSGAAALAATAMKN